MSSLVEDGILHTFWVDDGWPAATDGLEFFLVQKQDNCVAFTYLRDLRLLYYNKKYNGRISVTYTT